MSQRKKLSDTEASFLTGDKKSQAEASPTEEKPTPTQADIMSQILAPADEGKETTTRFTADLPDSLHERLGRAALKSKKTKVQLVREILDAMLPQ